MSRTTPSLSAILAFCLISGMAVCSCSGNEKGIADTAAVDSLEVADSDGEAAEMNGNDADADTDVADDSATTLDAAADWKSLPSLPPDKAFSGRYAAGAAQRTINPDHDAYMGGFGFCAGAPTKCRKSEGIHDDLLATAVALADTTSGEVIIFVGLDALGLVLLDVREMQNLVPAAFAETYGVRMEGERVIPASSHTHNAPDTVGIFGPFTGKERDEIQYIKYLEGELVKVALDAFGALEDVELFWGKGTAENHDDDDYFHDEDLFVLRGQKPSGGTLFTMTRWPGHPTLYGGDNNAISADWVGPFRKKMQEELGGQAIYLNGPIGSVYADSPGDCAMPDQFPEGWQDPDLNADKHSKVACLGAHIAQVAIDALAAEEPLTDDGIVFRHAPFKFHPNNFLFEVLKAMGPVPFPDFDRNDPMSFMDSQFSWITIGQLNYLTTPGESFPSFAAHAKQKMESYGIENVIVLGLAQDWMGYLLSSEQWNDPDLGYNRSLSPGDLVEPAFIEKLDELLKSGS